MRISTLPLLLLAATCAASASAPPREERPRPPLLRGGQCIDPDFVRSFTTLDRHHLLLDTGRHRYLAQLSGSCWHLEATSFITFRGDPIFNRVCGAPFDAVIPSDGIPCLIEGLELISKEQYQQALRDHEAEVRARRAERKARRNR